MAPILTAPQMRVVDRRTAELGIPSLILMENAGSRVVDELVRRYKPLLEHRIAIFCGKGDNGGDGLVIARQIFTRFQPKSLQVVLLYPPEELSADAAANFQMLVAAGCPFTRTFPVAASLVVDAILGTGLEGPARGPAVEAIRFLNTALESAQVISVDIPSGLFSDTGTLSHEYVRADVTVTFTAPKPAHIFGPACYCMGKLVVAPIGSPSHLLSSDTSLITSAELRKLFRPRVKDSNKGSYGHVLAAAGSRGRTGAAVMCGMAALRAGAGLVTVASAASAIPIIAGFMPELMTESLPETSEGDLSQSAADQFLLLTSKKNVVAIGPGLGTSPETATFIRRMFQECELPMVCDADALTSLTGTDWTGQHRPIRVLTPHPGEMARLTGTSIPDVQANRLDIARSFAQQRQVILVLKGDRTLIAFPDGRIWVNPTGSPAMSTGGTGDILTGLIAGLLAQNPHEPDLAIAAAVYLHGLAGELGAAELTEQALTATDLMHFFPDAIRNIQNEI